MKKSFANGQWCLLYTFVNYYFCWGKSACYLFICILVQIILSFEIIIYLVYYKTYFWSLWYNFIIQNTLTINRADFINNILANFISLFKIKYIFIYCIKLYRQIVNCKIKIFYLQFCSIIDKIILICEIKSLYVKIIFSGLV